MCPITARRLGLFAICLIFCVVPQFTSAQNITVDGRFSRAQTLPGPNYAIGADLGRQVGGNLFHSFRQFGLATRETATFTGPPPVKNVIGRVTGGSPSSIDGKIQSNIAGANLYLINPSGIIFGPNATVDVKGSFHSSTADYLKMTDGARFQATNPDGSTLSTKPPAAFGFLNATPANITVNGSVLSVGSGQTLGLVGGPISITGASRTSITRANLSAPAGTIRVTSVAGTGEVPTAKGTGSKPTVTSYGPVDITNRASLDVSDQRNSGSGGSVFIRGGMLTVNGGSGISTINGDNYGSGAGGRLVLHADGNITLSQSSVHANVLGDGKGAAISVKAGNLSMSRAEIFGNTRSRGDGGDISVNIAGVLSIDSGTGIQTGSMGQNTGAPGNITIRAGNLSLINSARISTLTSGSANSGSVLVNAGSLNLQSSSKIQSNTGGQGTAGDVTVYAATASIRDISEINAGTTGPGNAGTVKVSVSGDLTIVGPPSNQTFSSDIINYTGIGTVANPGSTGSAGSVFVKAGSLSIDGFLGEISSSTLGSGAAGNVSVDVAGPLSIRGPRGSFPTGIVAAAFKEGTGNAGNVSVKAGSLSIVNDGEISATSAGTGAGGSVAVMTPGALLLDGMGSSGTQIAASATVTQSGQGGSVTVEAGTLTVKGGAQIASTTAGSGKGGAVQVTAHGPLTLSDPSSGIVALASKTASGDAGSVVVRAPQIAITGGAEIASTTAGTGMGGSVDVTTPGALVLDGAGVANTQIAASAIGAASGPGGPVTVNAGSLTVQGGAQIASSTAGPGKGGNVGVEVVNDISLSGAGLAEASGITTSAEPGSSGDAGQVVLMAGGAIALSGGAQVTSSTAGTGDGGTVRVVAQGPLSLSDSGSGIIASATSTASGNAGSVMVGAPQITLMTGAEIASTTAGTGNGGSVHVTTPGALVLDGLGVGGTRIAASADQGSRGGAGVLTVDAGTLTVQGGAQIASSTAGPGKGGDVGVTVANGVILSGSGPAGASGITTSAEQGSSGSAGQVVLKAGGAIALSGGAEVASSTAGTGDGGTVQVVAQGPLSLSDPGTGIVALATPAASGNAGSVMVAAPQITLMTGAEIASTTAGTGNGGSVTVATPGALVLNGTGDPDTRIAASAMGPESGSGGSVTVNANALTVGGGAQIASSTAGPGKGGDVNVIVASDIVLPDPGPQFTAQSTGSGDAGSVTVSAVRLLMNNGAAISTEAKTANGGNITLKIDDLLYLVSSKITTSVKGETGNGGNITIDPQFVVLNHSSIIAEAVEGHGGNITINAGQFIPSIDSIVSASSQLGISGTVVISGPRVDVNGALVVLSTELRSAAEVLRHSCAAQAAQPQSSLVEGGRGGLPQDPDTTLPALYIAGRDINPNYQAAVGAIAAESALQTRVHLTMHCG
jgi:filamentous hemagglutinin family protein